MSHRLRKIFLFALFIVEVRSEDTVDQPDTHVTETEGRSVTLKCKYETNSAQEDLFWYIQRENDFPKYILRRSKYGGENGTEFQERFHSELSSKSVPLLIKNLRVSDSAVYYCALKNVGAGNKLMFGQGTNVFIESKVQKSPEYYKLDDSCLATDFTNHSYVKSSGAGPVRYSGKEHQNFYSSFILGGAQDCPETGDCKEGSSGQSSEIEKDEKINFLSLGLFWLRILFVKTVAFNLLMTFKAWMS